MTSRGDVTVSLTTRDCRVPYAVVASAVASDVWFWLEAPLGTIDRRLPSGTPVDIMTVRGLAARTRRSKDAIVRAVRVGRIPVVGTDARGRVMVRVDPADVRRWYAPSFAQVLATRAAQDPQLPQDLTGWRRLTDVVRALGSGCRAAQAWLARVGAPVVEWGGDTPFQVERRYYLAHLPVAGAHEVAPATPHHRAHYAAATASRSHGRSRRCA